MTRPPRETSSQRRQREITPVGCTAPASHRRDFHEHELHHRDEVLAGVISLSDAINTAVEDSYCEPYPMTE